MAWEEWYPWEEDFLRSVGGVMPLTMIAERLERTESSVETKASRIDVPLNITPTRRAWTQAELFLFGRFSPEEIATATGRTIFSVRSKRNALARAGGITMREWSSEEIALLMRHNNAEVAEITGRSIDEVGDKRLAVNIERNGWDVYDPERA